MTCHRVAFPAFLCFIAFTSSIVAVEQTWGDFAMPQRQTDVARTGLQAGDFGAFSDGVVNTSVITLQDLFSVPYNNEEIGNSSFCPANVSVISTFYGTGLVQDDELNMYATFLVPGPPSTFTIKLSRGIDDDFIPQWVTCTANNGTNGFFYANPALYKDANGDSYVILRDLTQTQFTLRASDGILEHSMTYTLQVINGEQAVTPDGVVLQPSDSANVFITSTDEPLSGTTFTRTEAQGLGSPGRAILRTMGSPNSFVGYSEDSEVVFFDNLGQTSATTVLNTSFGDILEISGLKDGRVIVLHANASEATLTIVDYDGTNRDDVVFSNQYQYPGSFSPIPGTVCEGADGNVYVLDGDCSLYRVDVTSLSTETITYNGIGVCTSGTNHPLAANEEGVFYVTSFSNNKRRGAPAGGNVVEFNGMQYGNSAIEQIETITVENGPQFTSGHTVPGAQVAYLTAFSVNLTVPTPMIAIAAYNLPDPVVPSESDTGAASGLFPNFPGDWVSWLL